MATFAEQMVEKYRTLLADSAGLKTVTVDGQSVPYAELEERLRYRENGAQLLTRSARTRRFLATAGKIAARKAALPAKAQALEKQRA